MDLMEMLSYQNLIAILAIMGLIEALKKTLRRFDKLNHKVVKALLPWLPLMLGVAIGFIPGALPGKTLGLRIIAGVADGALSGQAWKVLQTKVKLLKGKL